ncbi:MAG: DsrE family protein [Deltaproteobacteria bacterium]|nr:DsrE family protein [Deltaproteobacteria bacterium]MCW5804418.1 DsrE family protein [Deltaproteobacteria bacterium]
MKLGIVLATRADLRHAAAIALAARAARHEVALFAMDAGVHALSDAPELAQTLLDADLDLTVCSNSAVGLPLIDGIVRGSQDDHAAVVGTSDRVVALT